MKKALIVANSSGLITNFLKNDIELLREMDYKIDCACNTNFPDTNTEEFFNRYQINVIQVNFPIRNLYLRMIYSSYKQLKKLIKKENYDVVHCHSTIASVLTRQCTKKHGKNGMKVLYTSHGFPFYDGADRKKTMLYKTIEAHYSRFTNAIITICNEDFSNAKKMQCKNVYKINGVGVDLNRFALEDFNKESYRLKLGFKPTDKVVLSVGELNTNKNHQVIIRAISKIDDKNIVYAVCGREVTEVGKKQELTNLAKRLGVNLLFLGFRSDIPEICYSSDIGAIPSFKEGLGLSGIEMLASGIPVVGSNRQGIKDYIIDGETGYLCDPNSSDSFAVGLRKAFDMVDNGKVRGFCTSTSEHFSIEDSRKKLMEIYKEILGE